MRNILFFLDPTSCATIGVVAIKIPVNPVLTGIHILVPIATPAKSIGLACPDMVVSKNSLQIMTFASRKSGKIVIQIALIFVRMN